MSFYTDRSARIYLIMFIIFAISFLEIRQLYHIIRDHPLLFGTCIIYSTFARFSLAAEILSIHLNFPLLQSFIIHLTFEFQNSPLSKNCIRIRSKVSPKKKKFKIFEYFAEKIVSIKIFSFVVSVEQT